MIVNWKLPYHMTNACIHLHIAREIKWRLYREKPRDKIQVDRKWQRPFHHAIQFQYKIKYKKKIKQPD